ncbi:hypothetical protein BKA64DRAFT_701538 [Cadophora sp. MPI-SDFR-AT-0126]|nr:hypothetical protein BKA64DRAFT_701538 [Leotiomycetes sp. MPI-SDFR-AT-0126]
MCIETIVVYACGCFEVQELNCCNRTADKSSERLMYAICDEPYPSEISMQIPCSSCGEDEGLQCAQEEWKQDCDTEHADENEDEEESDERQSEDDIESNLYDHDTDADSECSDSDSDEWDHSIRDQVTQEEMYECLRAFSDIDIYDDDNIQEDGQASVRETVVEELTKNFAGVHIDQEMDDEGEESPSSQSNAEIEIKYEAKIAKEIVFKLSVIPDAIDEDDDGDEWFDAHEEWQD